MKIVSTIEARMNATRLPGKVLLPVAGKPILGCLIDRLKQTPSIDEIVLATTTNPSDDVLVDFAISKDIHYFRGSENNVMSRVIEAAQSREAELIVEVTGDNPLIDPEIIEQLIQLYLNNCCDYASNVEVRSYPIGMDVQVFKLETLKKSYEMTTEPLDYEHVTRHIRMSPQIFKHLHLVAPMSCYWPDLSLTLDEKADYQLIKNLFEHFNDINFTCSDVIKLLKFTKKDWVEINREVKRKGLHA